MSIISDYWFSSQAGGPGPGAIGNSLRFRGAQSLTRTVPTSGNTAEFTLSVWSKIVPDTVFTYYEQTNGAGFAAFYGHNNNNTMQAVNLSNFVGTSLSTPGFYRDPSAWYHYVVNYSSAGTVIFINGQQAVSDTTFTATVANSNGTFQIGTSGSEGYLADYHFIDGQALLPTSFGRENNEGVWVPRETNWEDPLNAGALTWSNMLFTSGNAAAPDLASTATDFADGSAAVGAFNGVFASEAAGTVDGGWFIWRPTRPVRIRTSFSIGTRNCTEIWVNGVSTGVTQPATSPTSTNIFPALTIPDGGLLLETLAIRGNPGIAAGEARLNEVNINDLVYVDGANPDYGTNGFHLTFDPTQDADPAVGIGIDSSGNNNHFTASGFNLDPDGISNSYDVRQDNPTNNSNTYNPLNDFGLNTYQDGNLWVNLAQGEFSINPTTQIIPRTGNYYQEFTPLGVISNPQVGLIPANPSPVVGQTMDNVGGISYDGISGQIKINGTVQVTGETYGSGNVIGVRYNGTEVEFYKSGVSQGTVTGFRDVDYIFAFNEFNTSNTGGAAAFLNEEDEFMSAQPAGTTDLRTANYPAAPIPNGRDHFRAITGPGQGADSATPGSGEWSQYGSGPIASGSWAAVFDGDPVNTNISTPQNQTLTWTPEPPDGLDASTVEVRTSGNNAVGRANGTGDFVNLTKDGRTALPFTGNLTSIEITSSAQNAALNGIWVDGVLLVDLSILAVAQQTFPNGLWWIKDRANNNQNQLVDSVRGGNLTLNSPTVGAETAYVAPAGSSVAWCWNAGGAAVANTEGTMGGQIAANPAAGFSITTFDGATAGGTYGHGLNDTPAMIIRKNRAQDPTAQTFFDFYVYHVGVPNGFLRLNKSDAAANSVIMTPGPTTVDCVGATATNNDGVPLVAYNFAPVPGYSAFGSYEGNGVNGDGPFIALDFRPAFFLHKRTDSGDSNQNWRLWDSTRSISNPVDEWLEPNKSSPENSSSGGAIDFLSNGVKVRATDTSNNNASGGTYIYMAFAENPFGGSNVSPATAR